MMIAGFGKRRDRRKRRHRRERIVIPQSAIRVPHLAVSCLSRPAPLYNLLITSFILLHQRTRAFEISIPDSIRGMQIERHERTRIVVCTIVRER
jgi:hypothetical protein